ncbi:MAG: hypothetical protein C0504_12840 [Candidatus Solibacter sp.]|nr:hypothetical protein [Candidatus Solibacter sp.]
MLAALLWQAAAVHTRFGGNWTSLYYSGELFSVPAELEAGTYRHGGSAGYDGQFYRMVAHDPLGLKRWTQHFDAESYRRRRIAVPAIAWALGMGQPRLIDISYIATIHLLIAAGVLLLGRLAESYGRHPGWGMAFLLYPASLSGVARLMPDLGLGVSICGYLLWRRERRWWAWAMLAFACLNRELGLLLVAAAAGQAVWRRRWSLGALWATAAVPAIAWWGVNSIQGRPGDGAALHGWLGQHALTGYFERIAEPVQYTGMRAANLILQAADAASMLGLAAAAAAAVWCWWRNRDGELEWLALAAASLAVVAAHPVFLRDECSTARAFSLLTGPLALMALKGGSGWLAVPMGLVTLRLALGMLGVLAVRFFS